MSLQIALLLIHCFGLVESNELALSKEQVQTYYYSTLTFVETPLSYFKGSIPLSKELAAQRNHYQFRYDDLQRLQSIAFYKGNTPRQPNHTANLFMLAHRLAFSYEANREIITFYDTNGAPIDVLGDCHRFVYELDNLGYRVGLYFENMEGKKVENSWNIFRYQWDYQVDGTVIESRFNQQDELVPIRPSFEFYRLKLSFNPLGHIALMQQINDQGALIENSTGAAQDQITTNAAGNFLQWTVLDKDGTLEKGNGPNVAIGIQSFNEYGYEVQLEQQDELQKRIYNHYGICMSKTDFDQWGNLSERRFYNPEGQPAVHQIAQYHRLKTEWDSSGMHRKKLSYFDIKNRPAFHAVRGYAKVDYQYDPKGQLTKISYLDPQGNLVNRKDNGIAYIQYEYDLQGGLIASTRYNTKHQIISKK